MTPTRGVLYMVWGNGIDASLDRSIASVKAHHPELPVEVIRGEGDKYHGLVQKAGMFAKTPFDETLFLDADTVVMDRLDFGFEKAARFGLACCICECPWARRYPSLAANPDMIEYNTGVLFFTRKAQPVFDVWARLAPEIDSSVRFVRDGKVANMPYNDQCSFAKAVEDTGFLPFVLPLNWNYRSDFVESFFGPIKIFHSYANVSESLIQLNALYRDNKILIDRHVVKYDFPGGEK